MKHSFFILISLLLCLQALAQDAAYKAPYLDSKSIPSVDLLTMDSTWYNLRNDNLEKNVAFIYFSHDCKHCQTQAKEIAANLGKLKNVQLLFISSMSTIDEIKNFQQTYNLKGDNVTFLKDQNFSIAVFYDIKVLPFIAIYDKQGMPKKYYRKSIRAEGFLAALH